MTQVGERRQEAHETQPHAAANGERALLLSHLSPVDPGVEAFLTDVDRRLAPYLRRALRMVPNVEPLKRGIAHQILSGGKRVRGALCVACCELLGAPFVRALSYAAAIEHMQNFTLVHDDIADGDTHRRAQESIWKQFGVPHGINIGDMFVPIAALCVLEAPYSDELKVRLLHLMTSYGMQMAEGQALDINLRSNDFVTVDEYFECTRKKTGAFLAMATCGGGVIGGADEEQLRRLREFAMLAGVAFQIKDDLLDLNGAKGRQIGSDILEGKRTLLVIHASRSVSALERRRLFGILNKPREAKATRDVDWVRALYGRCGAYDYAELTAARLLERGTRHLMAFPDTPAKFQLLRLASFLGHRTR